MAGISPAAMKFQFHKGAIKTNARATGQAQLSRFNSIKVRLRQRHKTDADNLEVFQFHKGAIKTSGTSYIPSIVTPFQFHKGAIKT